MYWGTNKFHLKNAFSKLPSKSVSLSPEISAALSPHRKSFSFFLLWRAVNRDSQVDSVQTSVCEVPQPYMQYLYYTLYPQSTGTSKEERKWKDFKSLKSGSPGAEEYLLE